MKKLVFGASDEAAIYAEKIMLFGSLKIDFFLTTEKSI